MDVKKLFNLLIDGVIKPEEVWKDFLSSDIRLNELLKNYVVPIVVSIAVITFLLNMIFGYPLVNGRVHLSFIRTLWLGVGNVVGFFISLYIFGWVGAFLAEKFGGENNFEKAVLMLFLISLPSLVGQVLGTLPIVGFFFSLILSIYSLVLLYKAFPIFLKVSKNNQVKIFILFLIASVVLGMILGALMGAVFSPRI